MRLADLEGLVAEARKGLEKFGRVAISSSAPPAERLGEDAAEALEKAFGELARRLVQSDGVGRLIVAGGETSGAVVGALGIQAVEVNGIIDPGVPSLRTVAGRGLLLALKSGNFGSEDFFAKTMSIWDQQ